MISRELMAQLFDAVEAGTNVINSEINTLTEIEVPFEKKCEDVKDIMGTDEPKESDTSLIKRVARSTKKSKTEPKTEPNPSNTMTPLKETEVETLSSDAPEEQTEQIEAQPEQPKVQLDGLTEQLNFIGLSLDYIDVCKNIKEIIPDFTITDGSVAFKSFYRSKIEQIAMIYRKFKFINCAKISDEISNSNMNHFVGNEVSIDIMRSKIDQIQQNKCRLSEIRLKIHRTFPVWKRFVELLRGKLFKDHELRGQHKREGLCLEHMADVEHYYSDLEGLYDAARILDELLSAGSESLSRQLTCILEESRSGGPSGFSYHAAEKNKEKPVLTNGSNKKDANLDTYDEINDGETVLPPRAGRKLPQSSWSVSSADDPLAGLGV